MSIINYDHREAVKAANSIEWSDFSKNPEKYFSVDSSSGSYTNYVEAKAGTNFANKGLVAVKEGDWINFYPRKNADLTLEKSFDSRDERQTYLTANPIKEYDASQDIGQLLKDHFEKGKFYVSMSHITFAEAQYQTGSLDADRQRRFLGSADLVAAKDGRGNSFRNSKRGKRDDVFLKCREDQAAELAKLQQRKFCNDTMTAKECTKALFVNKIEIQVMDYRSLNEINWNVPSNSIYYGIAANGDKIYTPRSEIKDNTPTAVIYDDPILKVTAVINAEGKCIPYKEEKLFSELDSLIQQKNEHKKLNDAREAAAQTELDTARAAADAHKADVLKNHPVPSLIENPAPTPHPISRYRIDDDDEFTIRRRTYGGGQQ